MGFAFKGGRALVTGAGGFIGSHVVEALLAKGARVRALVHYNSRNHWGHLESYAGRPVRGLEVVAGDVTDPGFMRETVRGQDVVFHLAALIPIPYSYRAPASFTAANVVGTQNVLEACRREGVARLVHTSTSEVYGTARYVPMDEAHPLSAQSPYAATKIGADQLVLSYVRAFGLPAVIARPFNAYGPRQSARAVVPTILTALLKRAPLTLGALDPVRDMTYVEDTARGFLAAAARGRPGEVYHLAQGRGWSVRELVALCAKAVGVAPPRAKREAARLRPPASEVRRLVGAVAKARRELGWRPEVSIEEGLVRTADYLRRHIGEYKAGYTV